MGDTLRLQVGPVIDRNGQLVPDGVAVAFQLGYEGADLSLSVAPALTRNGMAAREIVVERASCCVLSLRQGTPHQGTLCS